MGTGAARIADSHTCPAIDQISPAVKGGFLKPDTPAVTCEHKGGLIMPRGSPNVKIENRPAARCGDHVLCTGGPNYDIIVTGPKTVKINGLLAAFIGSRCYHGGTVTSGSTTVFYDSVPDGATFGDPTDATAACNEALQKRSKYVDARDRWVRDQNNPDLSDDYKKDPEGAIARYLKQRKEAGMQVDPPSLDQSQKYGNNCGHETARQICIQKCKQGNRKACEACNRTEEQWYQDYLDKMKTQHNDVNKKAREEATKRNEDKWKEVEDGFTYGNNYSYTGPSSGESWRNYEGKTVKINTAKGVKYVKFEKLPGEITPAEQKTPSGTLGSFGETRQAMLNEWCDTKSTTGINDTPDIAGDVARKKTVVASVDVDTLHGTTQEIGDPPALHAVTVTQMKFGPDGKLQSVVVNDTANTKQACGVTYPGPVFEKSLVRKQGDDRVNTNVVP